MKLTVKDRVNLIALLPAKGNLETMKNKMSIMDKIDFSPLEKETLKISVNGDKVSWDNTEANEITVTFTKDEKEFFNGQIEKLDREEQIGDDLYRVISKLKSDKSK